MKLAGDNNNEEDPKILAKLKHEKAILESETAILTAARNGIVEIVEKLIAKIPSSIYDLNLENKNVLLVAVENRRTNVVEALKKRFDKCNKMAIFNDLIQGVDERENTVLHLAATKSDRDWNISGAALQMMWHIKWFQVFLFFQLRRIHRSLKFDDLDQDETVQNNAYFKISNLNLDCLILIKQPLIL